MAKVSVQRSVRVASRPKTAMIDCDIHNIINGLPDLFPYLSARWRRHAETIGMRGPAALAEGLTYPRNSAFASRADSWPERGRPGSSLELMRHQHLDPLGIEVGVLNCLFPVGPQLDHGWAAALAQAMNDWQVVEWLEKEPRPSGVDPDPVRVSGARGPRDPACRPGTSQIRSDPFPRQNA